MHKRGTGPARGEIDEAALGLLAAHGAQILATARRYAATPEDAEDAYQRGFEILLTKAPSVREEELIPWLKTVVKHEAFALRRQRDRHSPVTDDGRLGDRGTPPAVTHDQAERFERLRQGAEALRRLKPQEIRALRLKAEGYSYREICEITGWTYTKVNRCLAEGRQAFLRRVAGIEDGAECERFAPMLSALADGEASADDLSALRPHMRTCLACRVRLREFRATPARVAALVPPAALAALEVGGGLRGLLESLAGAAQQKAAVIGDRAQAVAELATGPKVAAVAASAAAVAGGGTAVDQFGHHSGPARPQAAQEQKAEQPRETESVKNEIPVATPPAPTPTTPQPAPAPEPAPAPAPAPQPAAPAQPPPPPPPPPPPTPANEFAPAAAAQPAAPAPAPVAGTAPASGGGGGSGGSPPGGGGEFAP